MKIATVTIADLKPGCEYPGGNINARTYDPDEIAGRMESLMMFGQLQSLAVCPAPGAVVAPYYVAAGALRFEAFKKLITEKRLPGDHPITVSIFDEWDERTALASSIEENRERVPLHPVNEYEQMVVLQQRGMTTEQIAGLYGMTLKQIRGVLAMGRLSETVRTAFRNGDISAETVHAFTLTDDHALQDQIYKKYIKNGLHPFVVRREIVGDQRNIGAVLNFVGRAAYEARGGIVREDLFGDDLTVSDGALLGAMGTEKCGAKCVALIAEGWGWAEVKGSVPDAALYTWPRIEGLTKKTATAELRAKSGCVVGMDEKGRFEIVYGIIRPGDVSAAPKKAKAARKKDAAKDETEKQIPFQLRRDVAHAVTTALAGALLAQPEVGFAVLLAATRSLQGLTKLQLGGFGATLNGPKTQAFEKVLANFLKADTRSRMMAAAYAAGMTLDVYEETGGNDIFRNTGVAAVAAALDPRKLLEALRAEFDDEAYFNGAQKEFSLRAIEEACGADAATRLANKPKEEIATAAITNVPKTGWLPPEMRPACYAKAMKAAKKKPRKR